MDQPKPPTHVAIEIGAAQSILNVLMGLKGLPVPVGQLLPLLQALEHAKPINMQPAETESEVVPIDKGKKK
jgi:hypothetical protein